MSDLKHLLAWGAAIAIGIFLLVPLLLAAVPYFLMGVGLVAIARKLFRMFA